MGTTIMSQIGRGVARVPGAQWIGLLSAAMLSVAIVVPLVGQESPQQPAKQEPVVISPTAVAAIADATNADGAKFYTTQVRPILEAHCHTCHGVRTGGDVESDFSLATRAGMLRGGHNGPALSLETPEESAILKAINFDGLEMPPKGKLPRSQIEIITKWVKMGAPWPEEAHAPPRRGSPPVDDTARNFWSFRKFSRPEVPAVKNAAWVKNPIDAFVLAKLEENGLAPAPAATKTTLLRRVYFDLIGLPPTVEEVDAFLADESPNAYEKVVDKLLASPQHGERWARHWLDLVRYAETEGYEFDRIKPDVWRYRDYVIDAFNDDKPYNAFIREQLAGDEFQPITAESIIATGYYKLGIRDGGAPDKLQASFDGLDDVIATTSQVFLGLTMNCARCHDHKIDPIPTADYYKLLAFFRGIEGGRRGSMRMINANAAGGARRRSGRGGRGEDGPSPPPINQQEIAVYQKKFDDLTEQLTAIETALTPFLEAAEKEDFKVEEYRPAIVRGHVPQHVSLDTWDKYEHLMDQRDELEKTRPQSLARALSVSENGPVPPKTYVLFRGSPYSPGDEVLPGFPQVMANKSPELPPAPEEAKSSQRRTVLADWVASPENSLTSRVIVNRLWQYHFGRGIVRSSSDFGYGGTPPTHPELLDWLASEFVDGGWRLKRLHKLMVMSNAYQMSSLPNEEGLAKDPENELLWRFDMRRLQAEEIRDAILAVSGNLNSKMGGPSIYPHIVDEVKAGQSRPGEGWKESAPEEQVRRSIYIHIKRSLTMPLLQVFDSADTDASCPARFATTQPTQALSMLNSPFLNEQAAILATDVRAKTSNDMRDQVTLALRRTTQRKPTDVEIDRGVELIDRLQKQHGLSAEKAFADFCLVTLNLNEFLYLE